MSLRILSALNSPPLVAAAGAAIVLGLPALELSAVSPAVLKGANALAFCVNAAAVSVPGRLDGQQDQAMRSGELNPDRPETSETPLVGSSYTTSRNRLLLNPAGWAFAIWGPIYLGEAAFVVAQGLASEGSALAGALPQFTAPFVAANLMQSLWCASFRPSYEEGWHKYASAAMLAGTAYSLSYVHAVGIATGGWYFVPMTLHFGWTTAATLVNLNSSISAQESAPDSAIIALGHASTLTATAIGVGITLTQTAPFYGLTLGWALAACADGMTRRLHERSETDSDSLKTGAGIQRFLCWGGSLACLAASLATFIL